MSADNWRFSASLSTEPAALSSVTRPTAASASSCPKPAAYANATAFLPALAASPSALRLPPPQRHVPGDLVCPPALL
eukprot:2883626-Pleurochrysis_carterae.AAC.4